MARHIERPGMIFSRLGVKKTKGWQDYIYHEGGEENVPGTNVPRLKLVNIGERARGAFDDEIDALIEGLRAHRDAQYAAKAQSAPDAEPPKLASTTGKHARKRKAA